MKGEMEIWIDGGMAGKQMDLLSFTYFDPS
jgi:hypothetical protein